MFSTEVRSQMSSCVKAQYNRCPTQNYSPQSFQILSSRILVSAIQVTTVVCHRHRSPVSAVHEYEGFLAEIRSLQYTESGSTASTSWTHEFSGMMSTYVEVGAHSHRWWRWSEPMVTIDKCSKSTPTYVQVDIGKRVTTPDVIKIEQGWSVELNIPIHPLERRWYIKRT
jgi:hypothetical protein